MSALTDWTIKSEGRLRELNGQRELSNLTIAATLNAEFGTKFTRNAVIGKRKRMGLSNPDRSNRPIRNAPKVRKQSSQSRRWIPKIEPPTMPEEVVSPNVVTTEFNCSVLELENESCRWPVGMPNDLDFRFCGHPSADLTERRPYCKVHARLAYRPQ
jgi:GcrA cell cycle regulator